MVVTVEMEEVVKAEEVEDAEEAEKTEKELSLYSSEQYTHMPSS